MAVHIPKPKAITANDCQENISKPKAITANDGQEIEVVTPPSGSERLKNRDENDDNPTVAPVLVSKQFPRQ